MESITLCATRQEASRTVAAMTRPEGMTRATWAGVHAVLAAIARCYPKAYPSQLTLATRLEIPERTVRWYIHRAVEAGLLVVEADAGVSRKGWSRTNRYHICAARLASERYIFSFGEDSEPSAPETSSLDPRLARPAASQSSPPPQPQGSTVVVMREWDDDRARDVGSPTAPHPRPSKWPRRREGDPDAIVSAIDSRRRKRKRAPKPPPAWRNLADYFAVVWEQMQLTTGQHRNTRGLESYGQAKTYIEAHFANRSELEVRQMMNEFVIAVSKGHITLKPGQSGWMCFTGAWGRERHVDTEDIYAAYREK